MRKRGLAQRLATACGAMALGVACLVAAPTSAQAVTYTTNDGITVEATEYKCENGHTGTVDDIMLQDYSWSGNGNGNELTYKVWVRFQCPECGINEPRRSIEHKVTVTCRGGETTLEMWHGKTTADSITFKFSVASGHHTLTHVAAKEATCEEEGNVEYWECSTCRKLFLDAAATQETTADDVAIPLAHKMHFVEDKLASCTEDGWIAHYECEKCGGTFLDAAGYWGFGVLRPKGHNFLAVDAKEPTCTEAGNIAYEKCTACGKLFLDNKGEHEVTVDDVTLAPVAHTYKDGVCTVCGAKAPASKPSESPALKPAGDPSGDVTDDGAETTKPAATKLAAAKLLPQTGEEAAPIAAVLAIGAGVAILGIRHRHSND